jgi:tetratricopeptide (TPR) repeat protein
VKAQLPGHYDEGLHSMDYLMYAMLQTARDEEATELLDTLRGIGKTDTENFKVAFTYASSPARYALERRQWEEASELELKPDEFLWGDFPWARSIHHFARGIGAARSNQLEKARGELVIIRNLQAGIPDTTHAYFREEVQVHSDAVTSWILLAEGKSDRALQHASAAADREDAVDKHPVTPGEVIPARELYADMLIETGNHAQALEQYRLVLDGSPNRLNALLGAANAAGHAGQTQLAEKYHAMARAQTASGNHQREGLDRAWIAGRQE